MIEYRNHSTRCSCCNGLIPAGKIRWTKTGECPGHVNGNLCGAIVAELQPSKAWLRKREREQPATAY